MAEPWFSLSRDDQAEGTNTDYFAATSAQLQLIPTGDSLAALEQDYTAMLEDVLHALDQPSFTDIIDQCRSPSILVREPCNGRH